jgi:hypothetical protein
VNSYVAEAAVQAESTDERFPVDDEVLTPASFARLAEVLGVTWPEWYRRFVHELLDPPLAGYQQQLPGGLTFALPRLILSSTLDYRSGRMTLNEWTGGGNREARWPLSYVIVGHYGDGAVVIDTAQNDGQFLNIHKEDYTIRLFLNILSLGSSPEDAARALKEHQVKADAAYRERHRKQLVNPFFDGPAAT